MKRRKLVRHLEGNGCACLREGARHTIYFNAAKGLTTAVPRHPEIKAGLVRKICKDLEIPIPREK
jgi:predicted RNA binding protein YcfA (HicA-like mRNA interferase family)